MKPAVVTECEADARFLWWALGDAAKSASFFDGQGKSAANSRARSILIDDRRPVAVVLDADLFDADAVASQRQFYKDGLDSVAGGVATLALLPAPTLEVVAFYSPRLLKAAVGKRVGERDLLRAKYEPRAVLDRLLPERAKHPLERFVDAAIRAGENPTPLREHPVIAELADFLEANRVGLAGAVIMPSSEETHLIGGKA